MAVSTAPDLEQLSRRVDRMADQMDFIAAELARPTRVPERWSEPTETLVPVTRGAVDMATRELEDLSPDVTAEDAARFARTAARALPKLEVLLAQLDSLSELLHTVNSLSGAGGQTHRGPSRSPTTRATSRSRGRAA